MGIEERRKWASFLIAVSDRTCSLGFRVRVGIILKKKIEKDGWEAVA